MNLSINSMNFITLEVSYADLGVPEDQVEDISIAWYNEKTEEWEALPSSADKETQTVYAMTNHFTVFDLDVNTWQATHVPTVDAFQVSSFTGAATYSRRSKYRQAPVDYSQQLHLITTVRL